MAMATQHVDGFQDLYLVLKELPKGVSKSILTEALKKSATPVAFEAAQRAPRLTGRLASHITIKTVLIKSQKAGRKRAGTAEVYIGATWPKGAHGHLVEFGTSKMPARPFLRPAWDANKDQVLAGMAAEIWKAIGKVTKRHVRKLKRLAGAA